MTLSKGFLLFSIPTDWNYELIYILSDWKNITQHFELDVLLKRLLLTMIHLYQKLFSELQSLHMEEG